MESFAVANKTYSYAAENWATFVDTYGSNLEDDNLQLFLVVCVGWAVGITTYLTCKYIEAFGMNEFKLYRLFYRWRGFVSS